MNVGLQVYTVRGEITKDFEAAFNKVKKAGYEYLELYGLFENKPEDLKKFLDRLNLSVPAIMFPLEKLMNNLDAVKLICKTLGSRYAVCGILGEEYRTDEGFSKAAEILEQAAVRLKVDNITLAYHNHAFEFEKLKSGKCGYDILVSETQLLKFELDVFWVQYADLDPAEKMRELKDRLGLIHLKDMDNPQDKNFCELGSGVVELKETIKLAEEFGIKYAFVEQDSNWINDNPIESIQKSFKWLHDNF